MRPLAAPRCPVALLGALALALAALCAAAAQSPAPKPEEMLVGSVAVDVVYRTSASADDLRLPFYPEAAVESSFSYSVTTKQGAPVTYYARAVLASPDPPDKVARFYSDHMPGKPAPEVLKDAQGQRTVLAVSSSREVRQVTLTPAGSGSRIELVCAVQPVRPAPPYRPSSRQEQVL